MLKDLLLRKKKGYTKRICRKEKNPTSKGRHILDPQPLKQARRKIQSSAQVLKIPPDECLSTWWVGGRRGAEVPSLEANLRSHLRGH